MTNVLIVEDNRIDARLISHALNKVKDWTLQSTIVDDGEKAIHYLLGEDEYSGAAKPDLVILDLNLPKRDGTEVLETIRRLEDYKDMRVFILSSNSIDLSMDEVRRAQLEADAYFVKPFEVGSFSEIAHGIHARYMAMQNGCDVGLARRAAG